MRWYRTSATTESFLYKINNTSDAYDFIHSNKIVEKDKRTDAIIPKNCLAVETMLIPCKVCFVQMFCKFLQQYRHAMSFKAKM